MIFFIFCRIMSRKVRMFVTAQSQLNGTVCTYRPNCRVLAGTPLLELYR